MRINVSALFLALPLSLLACMDQPTVEDEALSSADQDLDCATGGALNDTLYVGSGPGASDSYTRPGSTTCGTLTTKVKVNMTTSPIYSTTPHCAYPNSITASVAEGGWGLLSDGMTDNKTECENSSLQMTITDENGHAISVSDGGLVHPTWTGSHCTGVSLYAANSNNFPQGAGVYTVKVKAIRGLEQFNHGYAKHTIEAQHTSGAYCW